MTIRKTSLAFAVAVVSSVVAGQAYAEITDAQRLFSLMCLTEEATGFDWENDAWVTKRFAPTNYVLTKHGTEDKDCQWEGRFSYSITPPPLGGDLGESTGGYVLKPVGDKDNITNFTVCKERWKKDGSVFVLQDITCLGWANIRAEPDGPFVLTRTYGAFVPEHDSLVLQIGKCSLVSP
jgi:hypothetical protein